MKKEQFNKIEIIRKFLETHREEIYGTDELKTLTGVDYTTNGGKLVSKKLGLDWSCYSPARKKWYFGHPETIKEFVKDVEGLVNAKN